MTCLSVLRPSLVGSVNPPLPGHFKMVYSPPDGKASLSNSAVSVYFLAAQLPIGVGAELSPMN